MARPSFRLGGDFLDSWMLHPLQRKKMIDTAWKGAWDRSPSLSNPAQSVFAPHSCGCPILFRVLCGKGGREPGPAPIAFLLTGTLKEDNIN